MPTDPGRTTRQIDAPAADWLTEEEAAAWLRVSFAVWRSLVDAGWVAGVWQANRQTVLVPWQAVVCCQWRLLLGDRPQEQPGKTGGKTGKLPETGGN